MKRTQMAGLLLALEFGVAMAGASPAFAQQVDPNAVASPAVAPAPVQKVKKTTAEKAALVVGGMAALMAAYQAAKAAQGGQPAPAAPFSPASVSSAPSVAPSMAPPPSVALTPVH